jgi:hypothetical protein
MDLGYGNAQSGGDLSRLVEVEIQNGPHDLSQFGFPGERVPDALPIVFLVEHCRNVDGGTGQFV